MVANMSGERHTNRGHIVSANVIFSNPSSIPITSPEQANNPAYVMVGPTIISDYGYNFKHGVLEVGSEPSLWDW